MGRESYDPTVVVHSSSSIALLQERFKRLQRVKEMREEREFIMRMLSVSDHQPNNYNHKQYYYFNVKPNMNYYYYDSEARLFYHPSQPQMSLTLWPTSNISFDDYRSTDNVLQSSQLSSNYKLKDSVSDYSDIDTSLHL